MLIRTIHKQSSHASQSGQISVDETVSAIEIPIMVLPFGIIRDHREREGGWRFSGIVGTSADARSIKSKSPPSIVIHQRECHMVTADYAVDLPDGEPNCYIERKSPDDLIGSLAAGHLRLRGEMERMRQLAEAGSECHLISESSLAGSLWDCDHGGRRLSSETILTVVATWPRLYGVSIHFAGDRDTAERLAVKIFRSWWEERRLDKQQEQQRELF